MLIKNINLIPSYVKIIFCALVLILFPVFVDGFALDAAIMQLEALSDKIGPLMTLFMGSFFFFVLGHMGLWISTTLLQAVIEITPEALTVMGGDASVIVRAGWSFAVGIGNMLLLLAFVVIALATILGYENYHFKKLLPRLVVVAFLMNFTLFFVGIGIDVTNFLFNSIARQFTADEENILYNAIRPLFTLGTTISLLIFGLLGSIAAQLLVPYLNVAIQIGWVVLFPTVILPLVVQLLVYGTIFFLLAGTFLFYFVVFVARIFIVQILAILGPVAFFSLIFPRTEGWWQKWLEHLIQWLGIGVIFIFLMYVGLALAPIAGSLIDPAAFSEETPVLISKLLTSNLISHIILLIYFMVVLAAVKSFIPKIAKTIVAQGMVFAQTIAAPLLGAIGSGGKLFYQHQMADNKFLQKRASGWSKTPLVTSGSSLTQVAKNFVPLAKRRLGTMLGPDMQSAVKKDINNYANSLKDSSPEQIASFYRNTLSGDPAVDAKKLAAILAAIRTDVLDTVLSDLQLSEKEIDNLFEKAGMSGHKSELKKALPVHFLERETRGIKSNVILNQKIEDFVLGDLKGENMEKAAPKIVEAITKGTRKQQDLGDAMIKAMFETKDCSYLNNYIKGADGRTGAVTIENHLDMRAQSMQTQFPNYQGTDIERGQVLKHVSSIHANWFKKNLGKNILRVGF